MYVPWMVEMRACLQVMYVSWMVEKSSHSNCCVRIESTHASRSGWRIYLRSHSNYCVRPYSTLLDLDGASTFVAIPTTVCGLIQRFSIWMAHLPS